MKHRKSKEGENRKMDCKDKKTLFWNVARIRNKDKEFWKYIKEFDYIGLYETWAEEKGWEVIEDKMSVT